MKLILLAAIGISAVVGCGISKGGMINTFGTFPSPDGTKTIEVTRRSISLVDFAVFDVATGKELTKDYVGSDAMRWFLYWETPSRLWGYGSDIGYFKLFEFDALGSVKALQVTPDTTVPQTVWDNLPSTIQSRFKVRASTISK